MKVALGSDHAGFDFKMKTLASLQENKIIVRDYGTFSAESADYPDFAHAVAQAVEMEGYDAGILFCGSANGVAITANKHRGIRAAICWTPEIASLARKHNNANVICIPSRFVSEETSQEMINTFLATSFEGGRHARRVEKIAL
jgi:ribose 5-phosphate isomerase B